jgi:hypothetical protein
MTNELIEEQAVLVVVRLSDSAFGKPAEREMIEQIEQELQATLADQGVGSFDGDEFGEGCCTIFTYGPNAEDLSSSVFRIISQYSLPPGSYLLKRFGPPGAAEVRIALEAGVHEL